MDFSDVLAGQTLAQWSPNAKYVAAADKNLWRHFVALLERLSCCSSCFRVNVYAHHGIPKEACPNKISRPQSVKNASYSRTGTPWGVVFLRDQFMFRLYIYINLCNTQEPRPSA